MHVQQLMHGAQGTAPWAIKTGYGVKKTGGIEERMGRIKGIEQKGNCQAGY